MNQDWRAVTTDRIIRNKRILIDPIEETAKESVEIGEEGKVKVGTQDDTLELRL